MYALHYQTFDVVMAIIVALLFCGFLISLTREIMLVKMDVAVKAASKDVEWITAEHMQLREQFDDAIEYKHAVQDVAVMMFTYSPRESAMHQLGQIMRLEAEMALDPAISRGANLLINKAKREHGKKIRKAADRKLERTERDYEARIEKLKEHLEEYKRLHRLELANTGSARCELSAYQSIISQELDNFIRLPSVRNACIKAINQQHKAWQEL